MEIKNRRLDASQVVSISGRLDAVTAPTLDTHCKKLIEQGERELILDFKDLEYLSSAGLRSILSVAKAIGTVGGKVALANAHGVVREVFEISGFLGMFRIIDSLDTSAAT
jgi:anti-anti-sigma factor